LRNIEISPDRVCVLVQSFVPLCLNLRRGKKRFQHQGTKKGAKTRRGRQPLPKIATLARLRAMLRSSRFFGEEPMRLGVGVALLAVGLFTGCLDEIDPAARLGCGPINGVGQLTGEKPPTYILVGEPVETVEAPAAFAELACHLAARQTRDKPLWVGLSEYAGGTTEAERTMRARLDDLVDKGAPIVIGSLVEGHPTSARDRNATELYWAETIMANVNAVGAGRALMLLPRVEGVAEPVYAISERYAEYEPMALSLPVGEVLNLAVGQTPNLDAPTIRIYRTMTDGYMGQLSLGTLTPAEAIADTSAPDSLYSRNQELTQEMIYYVARSGLPRDRQIGILAAHVEASMKANRKARIEARRLSVDDGAFRERIPDPFAEAPVTEYGAMARATVLEELEAFEKRQEQGIPLPWGTTDRSILRQRLPRSLVDMVEKELGYVPN
jgi:hypothetical protein